jgi:type IV secretory pathway ATPase VirB11/archaellum biosynthesis ATPase
MEVFRQITRQFLNRGAIPTLPDFFHALEGEDDFSWMNELEFLELKSSARAWHDMILQSEFLRSWIELPDINEIIFHGKKKVECLYKTTAHFSEINLTDEDMVVAMEVLASKQGQSWNLANPVSSFSYYYGGKNLRLSLIHGLTSPYGTAKLFVRVPIDSNVELSSFCECSSAIDIVRNSVRSLGNVIIAGPTGCGKTTLLKTLMQLTDPSDHTIILEDTHELTLEHFPEHRRTVLFTR